MTPHIVVDVGNTRIKWGRCSASGNGDRTPQIKDPVPVSGGSGAAVVDSASLLHADYNAWQQQLDLWQIAGPCQWVVGSVHPPACEQLVDWIRQRGDAVVVLEQARLLPLQVRLEHPDKVGTDRLLNAVAANDRRRQDGPAVLIDAGSAVTVDYVNESGAFCGGAIFPGLRLMIQALHTHTALLPLVDVRPPLPSLPGNSTPAAMQLGVYWAVAGGIQTLVGRLAALGPSPPEVYLTGGDALLLRPALEPVTFWPTMTLEGVRLAAEALP